MAATQWRELEPDVQVGELSELSRQLDCTSAIYLIQNWLQGIRIYVTQSCLQEVYSHVGSDSEEVGGLLTGSVFEVRRRDEPIIVLEQALESLEYRNSAVSLQMDTEIWGRADASFDDGRLVVGWYHSHPNLGAFFSGTDQGTQRAFFDHPYSTGWVIDPFREQQKIFLGQDSVEYSRPLVVLENELTLA